jgi:hypothetical protein
MRMWHAAQQWRPAPQPVCLRVAGDAKESLDRGDPGAISEIIVHAAAAFR